MGLGPAGLRAAARRYAFDPPSHTATVMTLWHTALHVSDVEHSTEFYRDLADYEVVREFEADDGTRNHFVGDPDGDERDDAALQLSPVDGPVEPGDFNHVALEVEDVDATVADLDDALVDQGPETIPEFGLRVTFVEDPDGYGIELIEEL